MRRSIGRYRIPRFCVAAIAPCRVGSAAAGSLGPRRAFGGRLASIAGPSGPPTARSDARPAVQPDRFRALEPRPRGARGRARARRRPTSAVRLADDLAADARRRLRALRRAAFLGHGAAARGAPSRDLDLQRHRDRRPRVDRPPRPRLARPPRLRARPRGRLVRGPVLPPRAERLRRATSAAT